MSGRCITPPLRSSQPVSGNIDFVVIKLSQTSGALADALVSIVGKAYTTFIFLGTDGAGTIQNFISFQPTGQGSLCSSVGTPFNPKRALSIGLITVNGTVIRFEKAISQFYVSLTDTSAGPANYFWMATNDIDVSNVDTL